MSEATIDTICEGLGFHKDYIHFTHLTNTRLIFGDNSVQDIGKYAKELSSSKALIVTDNGILKAGHISPVINSLESHKIDFEVYSEVRENPTTDDVNDCFNFAKGKSIDLIIGLGGGSSMDTAKGANFILTNGGSQTVNFPNTVDFAGGTAPSLTASGVDILMFTTVDGGTTFHCIVASTDSKDSS